jgi:uncharacterized protein YndB with AHSA1/START domain
MTTELPQHTPAAALVAVYPRWTLRLQRTFPQDRDAVWAAITEPDKVAQWTPFRPDRNLGSTGPVRIKQIDGSNEVFDSEVREEISHESLTYLWGSDQLRFSLTDANGGTSLTLAQTFDNRNAAASMAAGWHLCLSALELLLEGKEVPSVVGMKAMDYGWEDLSREYEARFSDQTDTSIPDDETDTSRPDDEVED